MIKNIINRLLADRKTHIEWLLLRSYPSETRVNLLRQELREITTYLKKHGNKNKQTPKKQLES